LYADARLERDHELYCRAAALRLPHSVVFAGPSAAHLDGVRHAAGPDDNFSYPALFPVPGPGWIREVVAI
jgi:hypothetical protein